MPCCCKDYVQASFVLGIILAVLNLLTCFKKEGEFENILHGIYGALIFAIVIFGVKMRNPTSILVWMVFAIIDVVWLIVAAVVAIIVITGSSSSQLLYVEYVLYTTIFYGPRYYFHHFPWSNNNVQNLDNLWCN